MANLFWKAGQKTHSLLEKRFGTEEEFEKLVFNTPQILEDIFLIKRQIRGGGKGGIPDIVGIDNDGNICIVEMKNVAVNASIIPQVLQYAFWAETNPDSIKSLWLECDNKPDDVSISWDSIQVRIIIIAPSILRSTFDITKRITYPVDLIEVKRWVEGGNQLLLVNKLEEESPGPRPKPVRGLETYDEAFYERYRNKGSAKEFVRYAKEVEAIVRSRGWALETKFNKNHCSFKAGFFNAFRVRWIGSKTFAFVFDLDRAAIRRFRIRPTKYDTQRNRASYYIEPGKTKTKDFEALFKLAYERLGGD